MEIDPTALRTFAELGHAQALELERLAPQIVVSAGGLGDFAEATDLAAALRNQSAAVAQRIGAASIALLQLTAAARQAATLAGQTDAQVATAMSAIQKSLDAAELALAVATHQTAGGPRAY